MAFGETTAPSACIERADQVDALARLAPAAAAGDPSAATAPGREQDRQVGGADASIPIEVDEARERKPERPLRVGRGHEGIPLDREVEDGQVAESDYRETPVAPPAKT
jgi:hypothetical protein